MAGLDPAIRAFGLEFVTGLNVEARARAFGWKIRRKHVCRNCPLISSGRTRRKARTQRPKGCVVASQAPEAAGRRRTRVVWARGRRTLSGGQVARRLG